MAAHAPLADWPLLTTRHSLQSVSAAGRRIQRQAGLASSLTWFIFRCVRARGRISRLPCTWPVSGAPDSRPHWTCRSLSLFFRINNSQLSVNYKVVLTQNVIIIIIAFTRLLYFSERMQLQRKHYSLGAYSKYQAKCFERRNGRQRNSLSLYNALFNWRRRRRHHHHYRHKGFILYSGLFLELRQCCKVSSNRSGYYQSFETLSEDRQWHNAKA